MSGNNDHSRRCNHPALEKTVLAAWMMHEALCDFLDDHAISLSNGRRGPDGTMPECSCLTCADARATLYTLRLFTSVFEGQMYAMDQKFQRLREFGFPAAEHLCQVIFDHFGFDEAGNPMDSDEGDEEGDVA